MTNEQKAKSNNLSLSEVSRRLANGTLSQADSKRVSSEFKRIGDDWRLKQAALFKSIHEAFQPLIQANKFAHNVLALIEKNKDVGLPVLLGEIQGVIDKGNISPLSILYLATVAQGNEGELRAKILSENARVAANTRVANDPKQKALDLIGEEFYKVADKFKRHGYTAEFVRRMHKEHPVIESQKTIERLVAKLKKTIQLA